MNKVTLTMIVLSLLAGGVAYFEYERSKEEKVQEVEEARIIGWKVEDIKSATIKSGKKHLKLERRDDGWYVTEPLEDFADQFNANSWITDIAMERGQRLEEAKKTASGEVFWAEYGLDKNVTKITLENKEGQTALLQFAKNSAYDGSFFARYKDGVYLAVRPWAGVMAKKLDGLRSKDVFRKKGVLSEFTVEVDNKSVTIKKTDEGDWVMPDDKEFNFDQGELTAFTRQLSGLRVQSFIDEEIDLKDKKKYGLHKPLAKVTATMDGVELWFEIGLQKADKKQDKDAEDKYWAKVSDNSSYYELHPAAAKSLVRRKADFMDKLIPFQFDLTEAASVEFKTKGKTLKVKKEESSWIADSSSPKNLKSDELETFLTDLGAMAVKQYQPKRTRKSKLKNQVVIRSKEGKEIFELAWGKLKKEDTVYVGRSSLIDLGFTIHPSKVKDWSVEQFFEE